MNVSKYMEESIKYNRVVDNAQLVLNKVTEGQMNGGLVNEETRTSPTYRKAKSTFNIAFNNLRDFNKSVPNKIKREASIIRRNDRMKLK